MKKYLLPEKGNFYKANLHTHTDLSDGRLSPEEMKELYKRNGYSVIAYTEHDMLLPHHDLTDENFLALSGYEVEINEEGSPLKPIDKTCHICFIAKTPDMEVQPLWNERYACSGNAKKHRDRVKYNENEPPYERTYTPECVNHMIKTGREAGFFVTYNHPTWSQETYEQYMQYEGMHAMEIYNHSTDIEGYNTYAPHIYKDMVNSGKKIFALASDDNHNKNPEGSSHFDSCGGFVMIKADELKYEKITDALFAGNFYASSGPQIYDLYIENDEIHITCSDAVKIILHTGRRTAKTAIALDGNTINEAVFPINYDDLYLRLTVLDANGKFADTSVYFLEDLNIKGEEE